MNRQCMAEHKHADERATTYYCLRDRHVRGRHRFGACSHSPVLPKDYRKPRMEGPYVSYPSSSEDAD